MATPAVTAVVPSHKRPLLMQRAVQSIVDQDYAGDIEVIVVFDACEPELPVVVLPAGRTLRGLRNDRSRGLAGARNTGILAATHEWVAFLDDDDYWLPEKLRAQVATLDRRPDSLAIGTAMLVVQDGRTHERLLPGDTVTHDDLLNNRMAALHSSSLLFRAAALRGPLGLIDEELPRSYGEDYDILLRVTMIMPVAIVNQPLVAVSWQGQSLFSGQWAVYAEALEYLLAKHPDFSTRRRAVARIESQIAFGRAASGQRQIARNWVRRSLVHDPRQVKAYLALAVALRLIAADRVARIAARFGKGI